tara:strand:+ start:2797 stop:3255 length:459 start_codon:yes stop_codon:yes gene_type:complete
MKIIISVFILLFITNCTGNKVSNYHGVKNLEDKYNKILLNKTNKNDLIKLIGPPSTISDFNNKKWIYIERLKTNQAFFKLGTQKMKKNNILIVELNESGILINKKLLNLNNMNDIKYLEKTTQKEFKKDNFLYNVFTSLREKINAPARNRGK